MPPPRTSPAIDTAQSLGRLEGGMEAVQSAIATLTHAIDADRAEAFRQREKHTERLSAVEDMIASIRGDMDLVKPLAVKWQRWQNIGVGIIITVGVIGAAVEFVVTFFHDALLSMLGLGK